MAKESRKARRQQTRSQSGSAAKRRAAAERPSVKAPEIPDPFSGANLRKTAWRAGLPLAATWLIGGLIAGVTQSATATYVALGIPALVTVVIIGVLVWAARQAKKARGVAGLLTGVDTAEGREAALARLDAEYKEKDTTAVFARAQVLLQDDPQAALEVLERIDLAKVTPAIADEARSQRAMIHLILGQAGKARDLVDPIDLKRHQDARSKAMMAAIIGEAWARTGQARKGLQTLEIFNPEDDQYEQLRPQLYRARAFAYAYVSDVKQMRRSLRKLLDQDARLLGGFVTGKTHPLLQKEARKLLEQSGQVPRKMMVQRKL